MVMTFGMANSAQSVFPKRIEAMFSVTHMGLNSIHRIIYKTVKHLVMYRRRVTFSILQLRWPPSQQTPTNLTRSPEKIKILDKVISEVA